MSQGRNKYVQWTSKRRGFENFTFLIKVTPHNLSADTKSSFRMSNLHQKRGSPVSTTGTCGRCP